MSKVVNAKCPECGARLKVDTAAREGKCDYCGAVSPIQTKKQIQEQIRQGTQQIHAIQISTRTSRMALVAALVPLFGIFIAGVVTFLVMQRNAGEVSTGSLSRAFSNLKLHWHGDSQPVLQDITGDGVLDPIGRIRKLSLKTSVHTEHLGAFNALTGQEVWLSPSLADVLQGHHLRVGMVGNTLLVADAVGVLKALDPKSGQIRWSATVGERVQRICGSAAGLALIETTDKTAMSVALTTGQLTPAGNADPKGSCVGVWSTKATGNTPWVARLGGSFFRGEPLPEIPGMDVEYVFRENQTLVSIAVGQKDKGTRVPMAASYDPRKHIVRGEKGAVHHFHRMKAPAKWLTSIAAVNPLTVYEDSPKLGAISRGRAIFPYRLADSDSGWRLASLDLATGRNLFDVAIPDKDTDPGGLVASPRLIFLSSWQGLHIFDLATGAHRNTIATR